MKQIFNENYLSEYEKTIKNDSTTLDEFVLENVNSDSDVSDLELSEGSSSDLSDSEVSDLQKQLDEINSDSD